MRHVKESAGVRVTMSPARCSLALAVAAICVSAGNAEAASFQDPVIAVSASADTSGSRNPIQFRKTVVFTPEYLSRAAAAASARRTDEAVAAARAEGAGAFARRYGISNELAQTIFDAAVAENIDPDLGFRVVRVESRFNPRARGPAGALGLAQLMPSTARSLDRSLRTEAQILEPNTNLRLGFSYLRRLINRYDGDVRLALLAYNRGSGTVDRVLRTGRDPENGYSGKVLGTRTANAYQGTGILRRTAR